MRSTLLAVALLLAGCGAPSAAPSAVVPADPAPVAAPSVAPEVPASIPEVPATIPEVPPDAPPPPPTTPGCAVEPVVRLVPHADGTTDAVAVLANTTDRPIALTLAARCPAGPVRWTGLPDGYDVDDGCVRGACPPGSPTTVPVTLPAFGAAVVGRVGLGPASSCHPALPAGRYAVGFAVDARDATVCPARTATLEVAGAPPPPPPPPTTKTPPPSPPPAPPARPVPCPAMGCAYTPCPPGVEPPTGCAAVCGCTGMRGAPMLEPAR